MKKLHRIKHKGIKAFVNLYVGEGCTVGSGCSIGNNCSMGSGCSKT